MYFYSNYSVLLLPCSVKEGSHFPVPGQATAIGNKLQEYSESSRREDSASVRRLGIGLEAGGITTRHPGETGFRGARPVAEGPRPSISMLTPAGGCHLKLIASRYPRCKNCPASSKFWFGASSHAKEVLK